MPGELRGTVTLIPVVNEPAFDPSLWFLAEAGDELAGIALTRASEAEEGVGWVRVGNARSCRMTHSLAITSRSMPEMRDAVPVK